MSTVFLVELFLGFPAECPLGTSQFLRACVHVHTHVSGVLPMPSTVVFFFVNEKLNHCSSKQKHLRCMRKSQFLFSVDNFLSSHCLFSPK